MNSSLTRVTCIPSQATVGDTPLGVCEPDFDRMLRLSLSAFTSCDFAPGNWFFCLNVSSQTGSLTCPWLSELPRVVANFLASSLIIASSKGKPSLKRFFAHLDRVRSMSGNLLLDFLTGDFLPSSAMTYFSLFRRTLETVL